MKLACKVTFIFLLCLSAFARDHLIFSIVHDIPMGYKDEISKKNYYVNIGSNQGIREGSILNVFRTISMQNPYDNQKRVNYRVKVGELNILHSEDEAAIAELKNVKAFKEDVLFEISDFMIGDYVSVKVKN